jgi:hypothetical protein
MDPLTILGAVGTTLGIIDRIAGQIERFKKKEPEPPSPPIPRVLAERRGSEIVLAEGAVALERFTVDDFRNLAQADHEFIEAIEKRMRRNEKLWNKVYPLRDASVDPVVNAKVDNQLDDITKELCADLSRILGFLESLGKKLHDHYNSVRYICANISGTT